MKHLNIDPWMTRIPGTSKYKLKRVSKEMDAHFPKEFRQLLGHHSAVALVSHLMKTENLSLAAAWEKVKHMVNDAPFTEPEVQK
jgi:cell wall assembly regulator SMI1